MNLLNFSTHLFVVCLDALTDNAYMQGRICSSSPGLPNK